jgi:7-carboxy-7-deazaguanine synthase
LDGHTYDVHPLSGMQRLRRGIVVHPWCDTIAGWDAKGGEEIECAVLAQEVELPRVCLTGGEPLLQPEGVAELVVRLQHKEVRVHLETNGTLAPPGGAAESGNESEDVAAECSFDWVVVSPKPPDYRIHPAWHGSIDELKLIVTADFDVAVAERAARAHPEAVVCLQPEHGAGPTIAAATVGMVMAHPRWRLSLQMHKLLGVR